MVIYFSCSSEYSNFYHLNCIPNLHWRQFSHFHNDSIVEYKWPFSFHRVASFIRLMVLSFGRGALGMGGGGGGRGKEEIGFD